MTDVGYAFCNLCEPPHRVQLDALAEHLLVLHNVDMERDTAKWPDGEPVIVDTTFEPEDFAS